MFDKIKKAIKRNHNTESILAPIEGELRSITEVSDPTFSQEILGKGVAIIPSKGRVVSPVDGKVALIFDTKHAISIVSEQGAEILIHVGLDTVQLKGEYFTSYIKNEDVVKAGDLLLEFDINQIKDAGYDVITPIVICNSSNYKAVDWVGEQKVQELDRIINILP